ncbi:HNH endonuclease signature motif containing protein [Sphingomonas quercus]|uniref:HNH endonuclease n=1 Tax=Sphingomonas quercus TaxID=2842451 RepID=A0ABS6BJM7_9SPHN|nr:HNH endonuclease signature motif containing protein [Sphingomonas quercus]MBU3077439.1 HNH endonuclease [Sphingomonas quercus]
MVGRRAVRWRGETPAAGGGEAAPSACALCRRPLGRRVEWHHVVPRSEGGRDTVPLHPICHRAIHAAVPNRDLARLYPTLDALRALPAIARFLRWIAGKPPDFHAPTR